MIKHYVKLDITQRDCRKIIPIGTRDTGVEIVFSLCRGSEPIVLPGDASASVTVRNGANDGAGNISSCYVDHANGVIVYKPSHTDVSIEGNIVCVLTVFRANGWKVFAPSFYLYVADDGANNIDTELNKAVANSDAWGFISNLTTIASTVETAVGTVQQYEEKASQDRSMARSYASKATQYAVGKKYNELGSLTDVLSNEEGYQSNAKYYAENAANSAAAAAAAAEDAKQNLEALKTDLEDDILRIRGFVYLPTTHTLTIIASPKNDPRNLTRWSVDLALESAITDVEDKLCEDKNSEHYGKPMIRFKIGQTSSEDSTPTYSAWFPLESLVNMSNYVKVETFEGYQTTTDAALDELSDRITTNEESITKHGTEIAKLDESIAEQNEKMEELETKIEEASTSKSEWDFVIDTYDKISSISEMYGNVLIQCEVPAENCATINVPTAVKYLKIDISIEGYSDYGLGSVIGHKSCVLEGCFFGYDCSVSRFKEVRNVHANNASISNCDFVYNCTALEFSDCSYVELASFSDTGDSLGTSGTIKNCSHICHVTYERIDPLIITNCDVVENLSSAHYMASLTITNAKTVDTVSGFSSVTYENCKYVNPSTCQDYVTQQDAVGKVQVLTADGSFVAKSLNDGSSSGGSSSYWDIELNVSPNQDFVNNEVGNYLYIYLDFDIDNCSVIQIYEHTITTDGVHSSGFYQLHLWNMNGTGHDVLLSSGQQITVNYEQYSTHFQVIIPQGYIVDNANYPKSTVQIKVLAGSISPDVTAYSGKLDE